MRSKIILGLAALALGTALPSMTALAQDNGQNINRPGQPSGTGAAQQQGPEYKVGRQPNDGGPLTKAQNNENGNGQQAAAAGSGQMRLRATERTARRSTERTGKGDYLRADVGTGASVAANSEPPRQYYGSNGGWNGNGGWSQDRYYDQYSSWNGGWNSGFSGGFGFGPPAPTAMAVNQNAIAACEARFRSFDPSSGTYLGFDGVRHSCP